MRKKIILWLSFAIVFSFALHSCVHDEINSSSDPSSKEYHSKSLWKEDEVYIKNVMKVYFEHETEIKKTSGTPSWDYATTMDRFDESFLMVPVVESGRVVSVLKVPRHGKKVYFIYTSSPEEIDFFQNLIYSKIKRTLNTEVSGEASKLSCITKSISVWLPDSESNPDGPGQWSTHHITTCTNQDMDQCLGVIMPDGQCSGGDGSSNGGYDYGGGDNNPDPEDQEEDLCQKTKTAMQNPKVKAKITEMKNQSKRPASDPNKGETGYKFKADGTPSPKIIGGEHEVSLGDTGGYQGGYHNHTLSGIKMLQFAIAEPNGNIGDGYMGMIGAETCSCPGGYRYYHYIIHFTGDSQELENFLYHNDWDLTKLKKKYRDREYELSGNLSYVDQLGSDLNSNGLQKLFLIP